MPTLSPEEYAKNRQHVRDIATSLGLAISRTLTHAKIASSNSNPPDWVLRELKDSWTDLADNICKYGEYLDG